VAVTAVWSAGLLLTRPSWPLVVAPLVLGAAIVAVAGLRVRRAGAIGQRLVGAAVLLAVLAGPAAWSAATAQAVHRGSNVYAGPGVTAVQPAAGYAPGLTVRLPTAVVDQVRAGAAGHDWAAAVVGRRAADLQLASGVPVWSLGGFSGNDPHPTLSGFRSAVAAGRVHYLVIGSERAAPRSDADRIVQWATSKFTSTWVGRWQVVDLTTATGVR
jgi:hypothetical protein